MLRATCVSGEGATRVRLRQADGAAPLAVDLDRLRDRISGIVGPDAEAGRGHR